jgi:hypothetical protein
MPEDCGIKLEAPDTVDVGILDGLNVLDVLDVLGELVLAVGGPSGPGAVKKGNGLSGIDVITGTRYEFVALGSESSIVINGPQNGSPG